MKLKQYKSIFREQENTADDVQKSKNAIKAIISIEKIDTDEEKGKFSELIQGLLHANNAVANEFLNKINDFTSSLRSEDYN